MNSELGGQELSLAISKMLPQYKRERERKVKILMGK
jgi:hypothetical protein